MLTDALTFLGLSLVVGGVAWIYPPAGLIVAGVACVMTAAAVARRGDK